MTILITGGSGFLGSELKKIFKGGISPTHEELDIMDKKSVDLFFKKNDINTIIHAAALTTIRKCEENKRTAWKTNVEGTRNLVDSAIKSEENVRFAYVSTACVFSGDVGMCKESSIPCPKNFYSLTKLIGECEASKISNSVIVRTNFVSRNKWPYPKAFTDRFGTYLFADMVAKGLKEIVEDSITGIVHLTGDKKISMFELAKINTPEIQPMTMDEYLGPKLTIDMSLDTERWKKYNIGS